MINWLTPYLAGAIIDERLRTVKSDGSRRVQPCSKHGGRPARWSAALLASAVGAVLLTVTLASGVASAASGTLTYIKGGNVFVSPADGGTESQVTRDGTSSDPYQAASQSASGMIVALRHDTAYRLAQSGQAIAAPVSIDFAPSGAGSVSADGETLAYEEVEFCGIFSRACVSTAFHSLTSGKRLIGKGLEMTNPTWVDSSVVGAVAGGVSITGPSQPSQQQWFGDAQTGLPSRVRSAAASRGGTRVAVAMSDSQRDPFLWLLTAPTLGARPTPRCELQLAPGPEPHVVWAPGGSALAWEEADGVWRMEVDDLSGADEGCQANADTQELIAPGGIRPAWSQAPYDPRPIAGLPDPTRPGTPTPGQPATGVGGGTARPDTSGPVVVISARNKRLTATSAGVVRFRLGRVREDITGLVSLKTAGKVQAAAKAKVLALGSKRFRARKRRALIVRIRLNARAKGTLKRRHQLKVHATITVRDAAGNATIKAYKFTLKAPRAKT